MLALRAKVNVCRVSDHVFVRTHSYSAFIERVGSNYKHYSIGVLTARLRLDSKESIASRPAECSQGIPDVVTRIPPQVARTPAARSTFAPPSSERRFVLGLSLLWSLVPEVTAAIRTSVFSILADFSRQGG